MMQENVELVQHGFRVLVGTLSGYLGRELRRKYRDRWWDEVLFSLSDQYDLPRDGSYSELIDTLDVANCIRLLDRRWSDDFRNILPRNCRTWANELMGIRNEVSHLGQRDLEQLAAERALDTMALLCEPIDSDSGAEIRELYQELRSRAGDTASASLVLTQPDSDSVRGALVNGSLLQMVGTDLVKKTQLSRKVTYGGKTVVYPVYQVRLDALFYNDQNDRIATWISRYEAEHGKGALSTLPAEEYNRVIEGFIVESNPESIHRTQKNIALVGQQVPGVALADGRVVDGNRRFTCLRRLQSTLSEPLYFETVLMDMDIRADRKQIKLLELSIQHGEEKKVDYDLIDYAVGTYRGIVQTGLLSVEEYARGTNEHVADIRKRLEIASVLNEFLEYIRLPEQYYIAREYQLYSLFDEMYAPLRQLEGNDRQQLKEIVFSNILLRAIRDQRKYIRDIKALIRSGAYRLYFDDQQKLKERWKCAFDSQEIKDRNDLDRFSLEHSIIAEEMQESLERAMLRSRAAQVKAKPAENIGKCISLLMDIDARTFARLDPEEKETVQAGLDELARLISAFCECL